METRSHRVAFAATAALVLLVTSAGCSDGKPKPATIKFSEVSLQLTVPAELSDLTYAVGKSEEGQPTLLFSTKHLTTVGGPSCAAGATSAVSPDPLGQIVVSEETPQHVREEAADNPEEDLGAFVKHIGEDYLYYISPPRESCVDGDAKVAKLQHHLTSALKSALTTFAATE
jgi:hypothetical protein